MTSRAPNATPVRKALWWAEDYLYAGWRQFRSAFSRRRAGAFASGHRSPILVVPGVYEPWRFMLPLIRELHELGHPVHVVEPLRNNRIPVPSGARLVHDYIAARELRDVVIVAHSKGGLIGKHVMSFGDAEQRIRTMVTIATPFGGSRYASLLLGRTLRAFRPNDATLLQLAAARDPNARIVSVYPAFDPHIPGGSELDGAVNVRVETGGHFRILAHPRTREVVREVASGAATSSAAR